MSYTLNGITMSTPREMADNIAKRNKKATGLGTTLKNARFAWNFIKSVGENIDKNWADGTTDLADLIDRAKRAKGAAVLKTINPRNKLAKNNKKTKSTPTTKATSSTENLTLDPTYFEKLMNLNGVRAELEDLSKNEAYKNTPYANYNSYMSDEDAIKLFKLYLDELRSKLNLIPPTILLLSPVVLENPNINLSTKDTDAILSHYGYKPNANWSEALRKYLGGNRNLDMSWVNDNLRKEWITPGLGPFTVFLRKSGGKLISTDSIKRFLLGGLFSRIRSQIASLTTNQPSLGSNSKSNNNSIANLQEQLFNINAFGNISKKRAVDGVMGNRTKEAILRAREMGYKVDGNKVSKPGYWEKVMTDLYSATNPNNHQRIVAQSGSESPVTSLDAIKVMKLTRDLNKNKSTKTSNNVLGLILQSARATGDMLWGLQGEAANNMERVKSRLTLFRDPISWGMEHDLDKMYPYSYGDVLYNPKTKERVAYEGQEIPEGWKLTLNWGKNKDGSKLSDELKELYVEALLGKYKHAMQKKDPRRAYMEALNNIPLKTRWGQALWLEMVNKAPEGMVRLGGNPEDALFEMRAREDAARYYNDRQQVHNTWELNPDFQSPTAVYNGAGTYRIKDPQQRERIYGEMVNWWLKNKNKGHWNSDHTAYIVPSMGFMGNHSLISDDEKGLNLRYGDWWDYKVNAPMGHYMYMADRLVPKGGYPTYNPKYGVGHNTEERSESFDDLEDKFKESHPILGFGYSLIK